MMRRVLFIWYFLVSIFFFGCTEKEKSSLPFIDLTHKAELKKMALQDISKVTYIPFDTDTSYLLTDWLPECITENYIVFINNNLGSILLFDHSGKIAKIIHRQGNGPEEYVRLRLVTLDERKKELYCFLSYDKIIKVYTLDGSYLKTLFSKDNDYMDVMYIYNDSLLLCWNQSISGNSDYYFLSRHDTMRFQNVLTIPAANKISRDIIKRGYRSARLQQAPVNPFVFQNGRYLIADPSNDTIFQLTAQQTLEPVFTRIPSIRSQKTPVALDYGLESKDYIFITAVELQFDFDTNQGCMQTPYLLEKKTGNIYRTHIYNRDYPNDPDYFCTAYQLVSGRLVQYYPAEKLLEALKNNELSGELKDIASGLKEDDNGVLMMVDFL